MLGPLHIAFDRCRALVFRRFPAACCAASSTGRRRARSLQEGHRRCARWRMRRKSMLVVVLLRHGQPHWSLSGRPPVQPLRVCSPRTVPHALMRSEGMALLAPCSWATWRAGSRRSSQPSRLERHSTKSPKAPSPWSNPSPLCTSSFSPRRNRRHPTQRRKCGGTSLPMSTHRWQPRSRRTPSRGV